MKSVRVWWIVLSASLWSFQFTFGAPADSVSVYKKIFDLESKRKSKFLMSQEERLHLASLYFLISDCSKVSELLRFDQSESAQALSCACDGVCEVAKKRTYSDLYLLKELLRGSMDFSHAMVQSVWKRIQDNPFAQFVVLDALKNSTKVQDQKLLKEISRNLEDCHVK